MAQELAAYQTELAQLRHERDAAVEARLSAERALQRATQNHSLDRNTYEHEVDISCCAICSYKLTSLQTRILNEKVRACWPRLALLLTRVT